MKVINRTTELLNVWVCDSNDWNNYQLDAGEAMTVEVEHGTSISVHSGIGSAIIYVGAHGMNVITHESYGTLEIESERIEMEFANGATLAIKTRKQE